MYIAMSEHATTRSKCARLIKSKMQVDTMNHHAKLAQSRRESLCQVAMRLSGADLIVYVRGDPKREWVVTEHQKVLFLNVEEDNTDYQKIRLIQELVNDNPNVGLLQKRITDTTREEILNHMDMNYSSVIYWVMVNSTYSSDYRPIGMLRGSDRVFAIGQRTHNDITS